jgi:hypothetical protein
MPARPTTIATSLLGTTQSQPDDMARGSEIVETSTVAQEELGESHWANDGVVPTFSQFHPLSCHATRCRHRQFSRDSSTRREDIFLEPGIWDVLLLDNVDHFTLVPLWRSTAKQKQFWIDLGEWLTAVDHHQIDTHLA